MKKNTMKLNVRHTSISSPEALANRLQNLTPNQRVYTAEQLVAADKAENAKKKKSAGVVATRMWGDVFNEEYISDLRGYQAAITFEKMLRSDYQVGLLETSIMGIIKAATFNFSIPDVAGGDKHAELCEWQWAHGFNKTSDENLNDLGSHIFFGNAVFEPLDYEAYKHPKFGLIWRLHTMGFRDQTSLVGWKMDTRGDIIEVHQQTNYSTPFSDAWIPGEDLIVLSEKRKGGNVEGRSVLRTAYGPWWRKNIYYKLLGIGLEKASMGLPVITVPPNKVGTAEEEAFLEAVSNYVVHENAYLKKTGTMNNDKFEGFDIEIINIDFKADAVINSIKLEDTNIAKCGAAAFSELGQGGNGGAYNLGVADIDFFFSMIAGKLKYICEKTQRMWNDLIIYNFGEQAEYPVLKGELDEKAGEERARMLNYYYNMGVYTPQPEDEAYLRKRHKLPELKIMAASDPDQKVPEPVIPDPNTPEDQPADEDSTPEAAPTDGKDAKGKPAEDMPAKDKSKMSTLSRQDAAYIKSITGKIKFKDMTEELTNVTDSWNKDVHSALQVIQDKYLNDVENKLKFNQDNKVGAVANIELGFTANLRGVLTDGIVGAVKVGKAQGKQIVAAKKAGLSLSQLAGVDDFLPKNKKWVKSTAAVTLKVMTDTFGKEALLAVKKAADQNLTDAEILFQTRQAMDDWKGSANNLGAGAIIPSALDVGRDETYENAGITITGWIYMNDSPVTDICTWLAGRTAREGDPDIELRSPPNHWSCESYKIPIMSDEEQPETWDGWDVPASVVAAQSTLSHKHNHDIPAMWKGIISRRIAA
jgi:hypothetical protein